MEQYYPLILDGATGTELQKRGFTGNVCTEQWVLEHPEAITEIQRGYAAAGSNIVYAPTFSANAVKLEENGIFNQVGEYNRRLAAISRAAVPEDVLVAGDMSPTGKFLAPMGDMSFSELTDVYREQAAALEEAGVDLFVVETMMTVSDARAAVLAIRSVSKKPIFVTFTCDEKGRTIFGSDITAVLQIMQGMEIDAFGLNCSVGPEDMLLQLRRLQKLAQVPLIAKPNAGLPETVDGKTVYNCPPEEFAAAAADFADAGVCIFGGCCGTHAGHIQALAEAVRARGVKRPLPEDTDLLPAATEKEYCPLPRDIRCVSILECDSTLAEQLEAFDDRNEPILGLRITDASALDFLAENQIAFSRPICFYCDDKALLEQALQIYQGRALYEGAIPEKDLLALRRSYGLIY